MIQALDPSLLLEPQDLYPSYTMPRRPTIFSHVPKIARPLLMNVHPDVAQRVSKKSPNAAHFIMGEAALTKTDRKLRRELRRSKWSGRDVVEAFEKEVIDFFYSMAVANATDKLSGEKAEMCSVGSCETSSTLGSESSSGSEEEEEEADPEWVVLKDSKSTGSGSGWVQVTVGDDKSSEALRQDVRHLALKIDDKFLRLVVHTMCRYYRLTSFSEDQKDGTRVTIITRTLHQGSLSTVTSHPDEVGQDKKEKKALHVNVVDVLPASSFTEFLFD
jgi:hypothetical protein